MYTMSVKGAVGYFLQINMRGRITSTCAAAINKKVGSVKYILSIDMSNRNFDSRVITQRLMAQNAARSIYMATVNGSRIGGGGRRSNNIDAVGMYREGMQSMYLRGIGSGMATDQGAGIIPRPTPAPIKKPTEEFHVPPPPPPPPKPVHLEDGPSQPFILAYVPEMYGFIIYLVPPAFNGKSPIVTYEYSFNGGPWVATNNTNPKIRIYPLDFTKSYTMTVRAVNSQYAGPNSNTITVKPTSGDYLAYIEGNGEFDTTDAYNGVYFECDSVFNTRNTLLSVIDTSTTGGYFTASMETTTISANPYTTWATNIGGASHELANSMAIDSSGAICLTGFFNNSTTINSFITTNNDRVYTELFGTLIGTPKGQDAYFVKYDNFGKAIWATNISGTIADVQGLGIACDLLGNIYATGMYISTIKLNNYEGVTNGNIITSTIGTLSSVSDNYDSFVIKYNPNGKIMWATSINGGDVEIGTKVSADANGNVYATGYFTNSAMINNYVATGDGHVLLSPFGTLQSSRGGNGSDAYIVKYNTNGSTIWATNVGKSGFDKGTGIATDYYGNVYASGNFTGSISVNQYSTISSGTILTSTIGTLDSRGEQDAYIIRYNSSGKAIWTTSISGVNLDQGTDITTDMYGNVYATGYFSHSTLINQYKWVEKGEIVLSTIGTLYSSGKEDAYIIKYDPAGVVQWATTIGASGYDQGNGISVDINGNVYATGTFYNSTAINSYSTISSGTIVTSSIGTLVGQGGTDVYVVKYNSSGSAMWAANIGGLGDDQGYGITTDIFGNVYAAGQFYNSASINVFSTISDGYIHTSSIGRLIGGGDLDTHIVKLTTDGTFIQNSTQIPI